VVTVGRLPSADFRRIYALGFAVSVMVPSPMSLRFPALFALALLALTGCTTSGGGLFDTPLATRAGVVDANEAANLISQYRATKGLGPVTVDATLMKIAAVHSQKMAASNTMSHVLPGEGNFMRRITAGGFQPSMAAENVAAGQKSLAEVLDSWRKSPGHNANLLLPNVSKIGIALSIAPDSRYKTWWTLDLGEWLKPGQASPMAGPNAGPLVAGPGTIVEVH
jgi:hypothetical protein